LSLGAVANNSLASFTPRSRMEHNPHFGFK
jgi:hypothetical protein